MKKKKKPAGKPPAPARRPAGLDHPDGYTLHSIEDLRPGDHLCCIYRTEEEHRKLVVPFIRRGLEENQKVFYIVDARTAKTVLGYLEEAGIDPAPARESGQLTIFDQSETYLKDGVFDPDRMIALLKSETKKSLAEGYSGLRVTGEMTWALRGEPGSERLIEYENKLNDFFPGSAALAICQYDRRRFSPETLLDILRSHPLAVVGEEVCRNFYYVPPEEVRAGAPAGADLDRWLLSLKERKRIEEERIHFAAVALAIRDVNQMIIREDDPRRLIGRAVEILTSTLGYHNAWIALFDRQGRVSVAAGSGFDGGFEVLRERLERGDYPGCLRRALEREGVEVVEDPPLDCPDCPVASNYGGRAGLAARLNFEDRDYGVLVASAPGRYARLEEEHHLFEELAGDLAFALRKIELAEVHRRQEEELRISEVRYRFLAEKMNDIVWTTDLELRTTFISPSVEKVLGFTPEERMNQSLEEQLLPETLRRSGEILEEELRLDGERDPDRSLILELDYYHKDGSIRVLETSLSFIRDEQGKPTGIYGLSRDVTDRKRAEEELRERERRLDLFFSQSLHGFFMCMLDEPLEWHEGVDKEKALDYVLEHQRMTMVNQAMLDQYGARREDFVGITVGELFRHDLAHAREIWRGLFDRGRWHVETSERKVDGTPVVIEGDYICLYDDRGRITGHFGVQVDVTESKRAGEELRESERRFRAVFDRAKDGIFIETPEGRILDVNRAVVEMLGYSREELLEMEVADLVPPEAAAGLPPTIRPQTLAEGTYIETENVRQDGTRVPVEVGNTMIEIEGEERVIAIVRDISERKRAREALAEEATRRRILIENSRDGIVVLDEEGGVFEANRRFAEMLGYSPEEVLSLRVWDWEAKFPRDRVQEMLQAVDEKGDHFQTRHRRKDGTFYDVEISTNGAVIGGRKLIFCVCRDVTERKRVEEELRRSEERYSRLVGQLPGITYIVEFQPRPRTVYISPQVNTLFGYTPEEWLADPELWVRRLKPEDRERILEAVDRHNRTGEPFSLEYRVLARDGREIWVRNSATYQPGPSGRPVAVHGVIQDITGRKQAEEELRLSEERFRNILLYAPLAIQGYRPDGTVVYWNREAERLYGYTAEEALGKNLGDLIIPDEIRPMFEESLIGCADLKESGEFNPAGEVSLRRKDGTRVPVHSIHTAVCVEGAEPMLFCLDVDLSERKRAEEQLRLQALVLDQIEDCVTVTDLDGIITYINQAEARALGCSREELIGESTESYGDDPEQGATQREVLEETLRHGSWRGEIVNRTADGREYFLDLRTQLVMDDQGNRIALAGISTDITERKRAEAERLEMERQLQQTQRLESLGVLAGGIAHDFNNILMVILGNAELALREMGRLSPARESVTEISVASRQAAELCKQMLAYAGRASFEREPLDLASLIGEMDHLIKISISRGVVLKYDLQPATVEGDPSQLRQVVMNLIINASEAIGERSGVVTVTTGTIGYSSEELRRLDPEGGLEPGEYALLRISDNGCGMDKETRRRVFEPFFTTKFTGRGLGMAAVLGIVQGHQGAISVESEPNVGTTFQVILPALGSEAAVRPAPSGGEEAPDWTGTGTILVAEDEDRVRALAVRILEGLGFTVLASADGREAVEIYRDRGEEIDLVILDLTMPHLDGSGALEEILRIDPAARVIIASGFSEEELGRRFRDRGLAGILQKPYDLESFTAAVRRALENDGR